MEENSSEQKQSQVTALPTPPLSSTPSQPSSQKPFAKLWDLKAEDIYTLMRPQAKKVKVSLQMIVGIILVILLLLKAISYLSQFWGGFWLPVFALIGPLDLIGYGLLFSTGIDLAYMLFTPGPDEAVEPMITGLAAAILLFLGNPKLVFNTDTGIGLLLAITALGILFAFKHYFLKTPGEGD